VADPIFEHPRLAEIYDLVDDDRSDLDVYVALVDELWARSVLDVGCGTGTFACLLAARGIAVTGVDPARASLAQARRKPGAAHVRWVEAEASAVPPVGADVVTMTGNVAQVFLTDEGWGRALGAARDALVPGGALVFEVRRPERRAWEGWTEGATRRRIDLGGGASVETWAELTAVDLPLVSFRHSYAFEPDGDLLVSDSTLRFRSRPEVEASLAGAGFVLQEVRDAPDRPGLEHVFVARRPRGREDGHGVP
jgi:SAM-dependent methyltransferase